jgi:hypothetical protein
MKCSTYYTDHSEAPGTTHIPQADDTLDMQVYRPKRTTCLRCGDAFDSYDPRYNRRCAPCAKSIQGQDDRYNY